MSFDGHETSIQDGSPFELFTFRVYQQNYRYTNAATDQLIDALAYEAWPIERTEIKSTSEMEKQNITLEVPTDFPILRLYDTAPPSDVITLTVGSVHRGDDDIATFWNGRVLNASRDGNRGHLYCENIYSSMKRSGLRRQYGRLCPHILYGSACRAQDTLFRISCPVDSYVGLEVHSAILASYQDERFAGGFIEWEPTPGRIERRGIKRHQGDTLVITHPIEGLVALANVWAYLGCKHTVADCTDTFDNLVNYGGWPYVPRQNPMGQSSVF